MLTGRIIKGVGGNYTVATDSGRLVCQARGLFRKEGISPIVGDFVEISDVDFNNETGYLHKILPRKNELIRPKAANVDRVILVCAIVPPISLEVIDGFLINCEKQGVDVILCINKVELDADNVHQHVVDAYEMAGYQVLPVSAHTKVGLELLRQSMQEKTSILAGPSGVGKSSILNAIYPQYDLAVGDLSEKIKRGKHTTRHTVLLEVADGSFVVDSPGFTSFKIDHIPKSELQFCYPEFRQYIDECYYVNCAHITEHDCAVKAQVGVTIDTGRYTRYIKYFSGGN